MALPKLRELPLEELRQRIHVCDDERLFVVYEALRRGVPPEEIHEITRIDLWYYCWKLHHLAAYETAVTGVPLTKEQYRLGKGLGFPDAVLRRLSGSELPCHLDASFKMVDTCGAEFDAQTPYFYSCYDTENEAAEFIADHPSGKQTVIVFGSGPIRIGQGIEFDYASVHCVRSLKKAGYDVVIVNNNPETVSTDFDTGDRLYFEPLTPEDVMNIIRTEHPVGVVVAFGGQTAIKLTQFLRKAGRPHPGYAGGQHRYGRRPGAVRRSAGAAAHQPAPGPDGDDQGRSFGSCPFPGLSGADAAFLCVRRPKYDHRFQRR